LISDAAITIIIDEADKKVKRLVKATEESLYAGIDQIKAGVHIGDIGAAIERRLRADNLGIVEDLVGHGVGYQVHEPPEIPNYGVAGTGPILQANMAIALEPMATLGSKEVVLQPDNWTITTRDGSLAAHFEHTVLVTDDGAEVLTQL
jgi:methionyl aminopeptidase